MKKTYIQPETIVVSLNVRDNVMQVGSPTPKLSGEGPAQSGGGPGGEGQNYSDGYGREVINTPDVWEEW